MNTINITFNHSINILNLFLNEMRKLKLKKTQAFRLLYKVYYSLLLLNIISNKLV